MVYLLPFVEGEGKGSEYSSVKPARSLISYRGIPAEKLGKLGEKLYGSLPGYSYAKIVLRSVLPFMTRNVGKSHTKTLQRNLQI